MEQSSFSPCPDDELAFIFRNLVRHAVHPSSLPRWLTRDEAQDLCKSGEQKKSLAQSSSRRFSVPLHDDEAHATTSSERLSPCVVVDVTYSVEAVFPEVRSSG
jgi:hypothetical protein